jgi:diguanylate cyclase (GGDEF)-like protein
MININSDCLTRVKLAVNDIAKAKNEPEVYKYLAEALVKYFGFSHVTVRKVDWGRGVLSLMCYLGFVQEVPALELPLSEEAAVFRRAAFKGESLAVFEGEEVSSVLRLPIKFDNLENVTLSPSFAIIPIQVRGQVRIVLRVDRKTSGGDITSQDREVLDLFSEMAGTALEGIFVQEELKTELVRDELTGLLNKGYFMKLLDEEFEKAKRYDIPLSCCIFDIDDFKLINETYGHVFANLVLKQIGGLIKTLVRHSDIVVRYGGEQFAVLSSHTALEDTQTAVERIRRFISALVFPYNGKGVRVTATFGISEYQSANAEKQEDLLYYADMALYEGKKRYDKNCVVVHTKNGFKEVEKTFGQLERRPIISDSLIQTERASKKEG